ncbi:MAG TPA: hypothetical protein VHX38_03030 [Pseudonocardiaceae bacterium]|jgi:hypothetical protein|nr:hypothetical protein [Pseudonocardiaceae bacterium]
MSDDGDRATALTDDTGRAAHDRREFALTHPLSGTEGDLEPWRAVQEQRDGNLLMSILAVDR